MRRIALIVQTPFTDRDYKRFGVDLFLKRGIEVDILELTPIINPGYDVSYQVNGASSYKGCHKIKSTADFDRYVWENPGTVYIDFVHGRAETLFVYRSFKKYGSQYSIFASNSLPGFQTAHKKSLKTVMRKLTAFLSAQTLAKKIANKIFHISDKFNLIQKPAYVVLGGRYASAILPSKGRNTKTIYAHTLDYDIYLEHLSGKTEAGGREEYAVFLDEYFPLHPDFLVMGSENNPYKKDPESYFLEMRKIFDKIEQETKTPVVIAAHPRAKYDDKRNVFGERKIVKGSTANLVANAKYVLLHSSTSVNFPVLFKKPMIFIMAPGIKGSYYDVQITGMAGMFGVIPYTGEPGLDLEETMARPSESYGVYKESYIKTEGSEERYFWDIVADKIFGK